MRATVVCFTDELKNYQARLPALTPENDYWKGRLAHQVLARWIEHPEREAIWTTFNPLMRVQVTPVHFIYEILSARFDAEQLSVIVRDLPAVEAKTRTRTKRRLSEKKYTQLAEENALLGAVLDQRSRVLGREKTGPRVHFMKRLSTGFQQWCEQPLDNVVRVLTEIAFGEPVTTEAVRAARSARAKVNRGTQPSK